MAREVTDEPKNDDVVAVGKDKQEPRTPRRNPFGRIVVFIQQVIAELKKVITPTRSELFKFTGVVLVFVLIMMALVYGLDQLFGFLVLLAFGAPT